MSVNRNVTVPVGNSPIWWWQRTPPTSSQITGRLRASGRLPSIGGRCRDHSDLGEEFELIEVEVLGRDSPAYHLSDRGVAEPHGAARRGDVSLGGPERSRVGSAQIPLDGHVLAGLHPTVVADRAVGKRLPEVLLELGDLIRTPEIDPARPHEFHVGGQRRRSGL